MQFSVALRHFRDAFNVVAKVVPTRAVVPIMQSVRLIVTDDSLVFAATDNTVSILHRLTSRGEFRPVQVETPGVVLLPKSLLDPVLKVASGDALAFALDGTKLTIRAGQARWTLMTENPEAFPDVPDFSCAAYHTLTVADFKRLVRRTVFAVDPDSTRYALGGCLVEHSGNGSLSFVATNGVSLATQAVPTILTGKHEDGSPQRVIPESTLNVLGGMLDGEMIDFGFSGPGSVQFRFADTVLTSRLCEGRFPAWRNVLPDAIPLRVSVPSGELRAAIDQAAVFPSDESRAVDFAFTDGLLSLSAEVSDAGDSSVEFPLGWDHGSLAVRLRSDLILSVLRSLDASLAVECRVIDHKNPFVVASEDGFLGVVMPLVRGGD